MIITHLNENITYEQGINKNNHIIRQNDNNKNNHNKIEMRLEI